MDLLTQLQNEVIDTNVSISTALRRAKVLAYRLKIEDFKKWVDNELNGYQDKIVELPDYRKCSPVIVKGNFSDGYGGLVKNLEIPISHLPADIKQGFKHIPLSQGIKAYENIIDDHNKMESSSRLTIPIPVDIAIPFFSDVYLGMQCLSAWKEFPISAIVELVDTVRSRLLSFALELQAEFPSLTASDETLRKIPSEVAQSIFHYHINGDNSIINGGQGNNFNIQQSVVQNDIESLIKTLTAIGLPPKEIHTLEESIADDERQPGRGIGPKTKKWMEYFKQKADDVVPQTLIDLTLKAIASYFGMPV
ncbi:hypothetical protein [Peribacillus simplex]|uniref:AbiTii domain-containing protein n=1 Tax=Peribacillus simplex TaxID=1478 RepID=UPI003CE90AAC